MPERSRPQLYYDGPFTGRLTRVPEPKVKVVVPPTYQHHRPVPRPHHNITKPNINITTPGHTITCPNC